VNNIYFVSLS